MRVAVVCLAGTSAVRFARRLQREFAAHGIVSESVALSLAEMREQGRAFDVCVLLPQVASAKREVEMVLPVWVVGTDDCRRQNAKKVANDVARFVGE